MNGFAGCAVVMMSLAEEVGLGRIVLGRKAPAVDARTTVRAKSGGL